MTRTRLTEKAKETRDRMSQLAAVAGSFKAWRPQAEVLREVLAVPTIFPSFDREVGCGGHPTARITVVHGPSNNGKAHANGTPVLTPRGWIPVEQLKPGQQVIGSNGKPCGVTGVYPRGVLPLYEVEFDDGFKTRCCGEHLWFTTTVNERLKGQCVRGPRPERKRIMTGVSGFGSVKSTAEIMESLDDGHSIPLVPPVQFEPLGNLPLDPYLLGLLLGDGGLSGTCVTFIKPEADLCQAVRDRLPGDDSAIDVEMGLRITGGETKRRLTHLELAGCRSWEKFVPEIYMRASVEERRALLAGLLDTDGHVDVEGKGVEFSSVSPMLSDAVVELARSLGVIVSDYGFKPAHYTKDGERVEARPSRRVRMTFIDGTTPVRSVKHVAKWEAKTRKRYRRIVAVRPVESGEATCISVDAEDRLYVAEGFVVTHNSSFCLGLGRSYLESGHFFGFADAERTTPQPYVRTLMQGSADLPSFSALPVGSYEQVRASVRHYCDTIADARAKGLIPADTTGLIVLDSLRKLVPEKLWDALTKAIVADAADAKPKPERKTRFGAKAPTGVDGASGRAGQIKAMYNSAWMDELIPLLADTRIALAIIAREDVHEGEGFMAQEIVELKGGQAIKYDASLQVRCLREFVHEDVGEKTKPMVGERIVLEIHKTKVAQKDERVPTAFFNVSNGQLCPEGFDRPRDVFELGVQTGVIETSGSFYRFDGVTIAQGQRAALDRLRKEPASVQAIEFAIRAAK